MLYLVEDQLNLEKVRIYGSRVCYLLLVMQDQISFWGPTNPIVDRGLSFFPQAKSWLSAKHIT